MSVQTQNTNLNPYSGTPIKNLEYIQNKALVIAPFEITKSGKLDPDLLLDTPGIININIYKKMVSGEDKEPTPDQFKTIKTISEIDSSNRISSFDIPVIFKYDKETNTRIIEKDLKNLPLDYIDFTIDVSNTDLSSETGSNGFFCVCQVQKIQKSVATTAFTEVANDEFLFMIPSVECREIPELVEFDLLDSDNKVINIKKFSLPADIYKENVSLLLDGNDLTDKTGKAITNTNVTIDTSVKKYGSGSLKFSRGQLLISSTDFTFGSNDLTIEGWFNFASLPSDFMLFDAGGYLTANGVSIEYFNNKLLMNYNNNQWIFSNNSLIINTWYHIAVTRNNNTIYLYLDGIKIAQVVMTQSFDSDNKISLGCAKDLRWPMNGHIDDFRVTKGVARYTANFTPPNELSYVINNNTFSLPADIYKDKVSLLLDGNDLTDKTGKTITNTGVTVDTSVKKYGSGSLKFNKSSYLTLYSTDFALGTDDFTIDFWIKWNSFGGEPGIFQTSTTGLKPSYETGITMYKSFGTYVVNIMDTFIRTSFTPSLNTWHHIAIVRKSNILTIYSDGISIGSVNNSSNLTSTYCVVGGYYSTGFLMDGYIDDFRVTKGIARYTANFTPPNELSYVININEQEQGYRIYPAMKISDHTTEETSFSPKYYLGTKYQRNLMEILSHSIKSKRTISNLKDMYLVDDLCIQTLKKINILLENNQMIKLTERLCNLATSLREKLNADLILEYLSTSVSGSQNMDIATTLKTSLIEDYNFTQDEIDNLNDNLNTFKSRARISLTTPVIHGSSLDQLRFNLPKTFVDGNRSKTEKKNLLVFGTDAGFNKFGLSGYNVPYSNISKRDTSVVLDYNNLTLGLPVLSSQNFKPVVDDKTFMMYSGSLTDATGKTPTLTGVSLSTTTKKFNDSSIYINKSFITIPAGANLSIGTKDFTVETWINPTSILDVPIFTLGLNQSQLCFIVIILSNGAVLFRAGVGSWGWDFASDRTTAANLVKANTWNHIVTQRRNGNLEIYVNGILSYTGVWAYNIPNGNNLYIGGYVGGSDITAYYDDISISNGVGRYASNFTFKISSTFKDILTNYKQQIPFTYIPLSTDAANTNNEPVFENLTDITGFTNSDIVIDIPNVL